MVDLVAVLRELGIYEVFELLVAFQIKFLINKRTFRGIQTEPHRIRSLTANGACHQERVG
tara:strand:- start:463 stop:642 length:180 start_codon:yes stop_codon:yes gene_type:complete